MSVTQLRFPQLAFVQPELEALARHFLFGFGKRDLHETKGSPRLRLGRADLHQQLIARRTTAPQRPQLP